MKNGLALTPPMGWNSYDCFGNMVTEEQVKANADYMAARLLAHGWNYIVVDIQWSAPWSGVEYCSVNTPLTMDDYGRLIPAPDRFPSSAGNGSFQALADYVHSLGLKFGIHIMRGIPRKAVELDLPIIGTDQRASDVADKQSTCDWCPDMYGLKMTEEGARAYYDSIVKLYTGWGVDFIKADDMSYPYHKEEIEALSYSISVCDRDIVLSLSPGEAPLAQCDHLKQHSHMWRVSADFWDNWEDLLRAFDLAEKWVGHAQPGGWPDSDMIPFGRLEVHPYRLGETRDCLFTRDEQISLMTLWCIVRSPLMFGGNLPDNDLWTESLIANNEVLSLLSLSVPSRQMIKNDEVIVWVMTEEQNHNYVAIFNISDKPKDFTFGLDDLGINPGPFQARDLWLRRDLGKLDHKVMAGLNPHSAKLILLTPDTKND